MSESDCDRRQTILNRNCHSCHVVDDDVVPQLPLEAEFLPARANPIVLDDVQSLRLSYFGEAP